MTIGTMHKGGFVTAGAARLGVCPSPALLQNPGTAAPTYATWLDELIGGGKQASHRFTRATARRPLERFP